MKNKIIKIFIFMVIVLIACFSIGFGIYFNNKCRPQNIMGKVITGIDSNITLFLDDREKYFLGNSFSVESNIKFKLNSEDLVKKSKTDTESLKLYNTLNNLNKLDSNIKFSQDNKNKKLFISMDEVIDNKSILGYKYLIDNSTEYYYLDGAVNNYINNGTSNYFEVIDNENTSLDNIKYIHDYMIDSLKRSIKDEYLDTYKVNLNIDGKSMDVNQVSLRIDDKVLHNIFSDILEDFKSDEKANKIVSSIDEDFNKRKISDKTKFLDKNENYTINIYSSKYLYNILKYEVIYMNGDYKEVYSYEGDNTVGTLYYIENDKVIYQIDVSISDNSYLFKINNSKGREVGSLKIDKDDKGYYINYSLDDSGKRIDVVYSSKYLDFKKNKEYVNSKNLSIKYIKDKVSIIDGVIDVNSKYSNNVNIDEDVSDAVLSSTLEDKVLESINGKIGRIKERLEK